MNMNIIYAIFVVCLAGAFLAWRGGR